MSSSFFAKGWPNTDIGRRLPDLDRATVAGISVAITGNVLISLALNFQKLAHRRQESERNHAEEAKLRAQNERRPGATPRAPTPIDEDNDTASSPTVTAPESEPLLPRYNGVHNYGSRAPAKDDQRPNGRWSILSRFRRDRSAAAARKADDEHLTAVHTVLPVDVITVAPVRTTNGTITADGDSGHDESTESNYLRSKLWWLGFLLMNVGEIGNFISYAFAPASVVAPLGTFALIANCLFAPLILGERFHKLDLFGILVAIIGAVTVVLSTNPSDDRLDPAGLLKAMGQQAFIVYTIVYIIGAVVLSSLSEGALGKRWVYVDVGLCGIFGGFTVLSTKAISTLLTMEWFEIFTEWITYPVIAVLIGTGVGQIRYLNRALMRFDSKVVVPTQFVFFNLSAIVGSAILYGDFKRATFHQFVTFLYGCGATFLGVFIITWTQRAPDEEDEGEDDEDEGDVTDLEEGAGVRTPRDKEWSVPLALQS
ncbi:hypothetical protein EIP91_000899 [Steccherinum ochraceum]|uniref:NIPA-like protein 2 n=1 Tax=Steccherinum ochraceum TaxID=92696 RepID=A0A4R0RF54_9APHY|nr:hypothetical protein EIP91_000899 [Steccherinum ochraceum]